LQLCARQGREKGFGVSVIPFGVKKKGLEAFGSPFWFLRARRNGLAPGMEKVWAEEWEHTRTKETRE
jgi:hypothetical protein